MNIRYTPVDISARVKDVDGQKDVMKDITVMVDCVDEETGVSVFYQLHYKFPEENNYTKDQPFIEFDDITEENINSFVKEMIDNSSHMKEWAEQRIQEIIDEPVKKLFSFQRSYSNSIETNVGIGSTPTPDLDSTSET